MKYAIFSDDFLSYFRLDGETLVLTDKRGYTRAVKLLPYDERPKGKWVISQTMDCHSDIVNVYTCPFCGKKEYSAYPFCHCGADMRGDPK